MATEACDYKLAQDIGVSCDNPQVMGMKNTGYLINYDEVDFDSIEYDTDNGHILTSLPLTSGARAYKVYVPGKTPFTGTQVEMSEGTYRNKFNKTAAIVVLDSGPDVTKNIIDNLANGKFVFVFENKYQGTDQKNTFEVYGLEQGLSASELTNEKYSEDTDGGWAVTLIEENAPSSGKFLFDTDISATRQLLETLVVGGEETGN